MNYLMRQISASRWKFAWLIACLLWSLAACASGPRLVEHGFSFAGHFDKWAKQADLMEYSYGDQYRMVQDKVESNSLRLGYSAGVYGAIPVGEFLYVKWRLKDGGEVIEQRVDLRPLLPSDMRKHRLTFVIDGRQLYVYLVTPKAKPKGGEDSRTYLSYSWFTYEIYPTNTYPR